ncbi:HU family DNA-binding protein [Legionella feeleii]|uniref:Integration host factor beta subunit n=1 Tax=Legionella feeleii TaxID=453 RepID=A0A378KN65_9GAMM|nr:HU family DNA-binding protein [Legionella feeleii]STX88304.1 integration host factor beta subunit [Legionella feeleii]
MIKSELIKLIAAKMNHLPEKLVENGINRILATKTQALERGQRIEIRGFDTIAVHHMPARAAHNPKTGEKTVVSSKYKVHFKPGLDLKRRVIASQETVVIKND